LFMMFECLISHAKVNIASGRRVTFIRAYVTQITDLLTVFTGVGSCSEIEIRSWISKIDVSYKWR
jgi:hypothetical protein